MSCDIISTVEPALNVLDPKVDVNIRDLTHHIVCIYSWCVFWEMAYDSVSIRCVMCSIVCFHEKNKSPTIIIFSVDHSDFVVEIVWVPHKLFTSAYQLSN